MCVRAVVCRRAFSLCNQSSIGVLSTVHFSHNTLAYLFDDFVMRECLADHEKPPPSGTEGIVLQ